MKKFAKVLIALMLLTMLFACAQSEGSISTVVSMRVSRLTQDAVVNVGEDLSIEIGVSGIEPAMYKWYFNDAEIEGADQSVYNIVNASVEKAGIYRMDAFDENGKMLISMDMAVRVMEPVVPKTGDTSRPVLAAVLAFAALAGFAALSIRRRKA